MSKIRENICPVSIKMKYFSNMHLDLSFGVQKHFKLKNTGIPSLGVIDLILLSDLSQRTTKPMIRRVRSMKTQISLPLKCSL